MIYSLLRNCVFALLPALFFLVIVTGCVSDTSARNTGTVETVPDVDKSTTSKAPKPLTQEYLEDLVAKRLDNPRDLRSAVITMHGEDKLIDIKVNRPETCHDGALFGISATLAQKTMALLFKYPEVARVELTVFGTSAQVKNEEVAIRLAVDRTAAQKIDWFQFTDRTMPQMATEFYVDSKIQASFNVEGGDPSGPRSQQDSPPNASST